MRTYIIYPVIITLVCITLITSGILDALLVFLLSGSLPGTPINLSPTMMMALLVAVAWLTLSHFTTLGTSHFLAVRRFMQRSNKRHARMPKRRYSRI